MARAFQAHHLQPRTTAKTQSKSNHTHRNQNSKPTKQLKLQNENTESEPIVKKTYIGLVIIF